MKKFCKKIHLWLSIPVGLVFCMMCVTGAILVFEDEITNAAYSELRQIAPQGNSLSMSELEAAITPTLARGVEIRSIKASDSPDQAYKVTLTKPKGAALYVNQYTGAVVGGCSRLPFFSKTQALHRWILDAPKDGKSVGKAITGWCVIGSFFILLTGLVIWWPLSRKMLSSRLTIKSRPAFAFWYSLHAACGFYALIVLLVLVLTGLTWSFPWYKDIAIAICGNISFKPIHTGAWLGIASKILWFIVAIIGAMLPLTGYYFWIRSLVRKHK